MRLAVGASLALLLLLAPSPRPGVSASSATEGELRVTGTAWIDENLDGTPQPEEPVAANVEVDGAAGPYGRGLIGIDQWRTDDAGHFDLIVRRDVEYHAGSQSRRLVGDFALSIIVTYREPWFIPTPPP